MNRIQIQLDNETENHQKLLKSAESDDFEQTRHLILIKGVNPSILSRNQLNNLTRRAVFNNDIPMLEKLLEYKPDLNISRTSELSVLWIAVLYGYEDIARILVHAGAKLDERLGKQPLYERESSLLHVVITAGNQFKQLTDLLIDNGADPNAKDSCDTSVLQYASMLGNPKVIRKLLKVNAKVNLANYQGETALHVAAFGGSATDEIMDLLLEAGANPRAKNNKGMNALHYLSKTHKCGTLAARLLLKWGLEIDETDGSGFTALHYAVGAANEHLVELLLDKGANVNAKSTTGTFPLYLSARNNKQSIIRLLMKGGANIHARTKKGRTVMHSACMNKNADNIRILLEYGAILNVKDDEGTTPFSLIEYKNLSPAIKMVLQRYAILANTGENIDQGDIDSLHYYPELQSYYKDCLEEVLRLKEEKFYEDFSYLCILTKTIKQLTSLVTNEDFLEGYRVKERQDSFPIYGLEMDQRMKLAEETKYILCSGEEYLHESFGNLLPLPIIERILIYLYADDLHF